MTAVQGELRSAHCHFSYQYVSNFTTTCGFLRSEPYLAWLHWARRPAFHCGDITYYNYWNIQCSRKLAVYDFYVRDNSQTANTNTTKVQAGVMSLCFSCSLVGYIVSKQYLLFCCWRTNISSITASVTSWLNAQCKLDLYWPCCLESTSRNCPQQHFKRF